MKQPIIAAPKRVRRTTLSAALIVIVPPVVLAVSAQAFVQTKPTTPTSSKTPTIIFNRDIRPILSDNCFACHGPDKNKRQADLRLDQPNRAIVPGSVSASSVIKRINAADGDALQMPPAAFHKKLTAVQKRLMTQWIASGAKYQRHWSYEMPVKAPIPTGQNPIDFLVRQRLTEVGLKPSKTADRRTLIRRLSFDLLGLPPTDAETQAFLADRSPDAYNTLVERLLANPHYGERMAQSWLDVTRFADTIGYHSDTPRNIWPYRDYVINSFNANKRFDRFTLEQVAGDLLPDANLETRVGSAYNRLLLTTEEGGAQAKDYEARYLTDRVRAIGTVWLGQTTGCSQCHDHKFDPYKTKDFYRLGAYFADIEEGIIGAREPGMPVPTPENTAELARRDAKIADLEKRFNGPHPELAAAYAAWEKAAANESKWAMLKPGKVSSISGTILTIQPDGSVLASGPTAPREAYIQDSAFTGSLAGIRLEVLPHDSLPQKGPGRAGNGNFVLTEVKAEIIGANGQSRPLKFVKASADVEQTLVAEGNPYKAWNAASTIDDDVKGEAFGWAILPEVGKPHTLTLKFASAVDVAAGETLRVVLKQNHGTDHNIGHYRLSVTNSPDALEASSKVPVDIAAIVATPAAQRTAEQTAKAEAYFRSVAPELAALRTELAEAKKGRTDYENSIPKCLVTNKNRQPRLVRILPRGNFLDESGEVVQPGTPEFLPPSGGGSRLDLANWLISKENPLTARAVMNRLWKQFFGLGISRVVEDLGGQGEPPSNGPLLDWLACEFRDSGWDWKHMVRLLVTSNSYKQVSEPTKEQMQKDPLNREFARQGRFRLEAEEVRDNALAVSGLLSLKIGGPSVKPYQPERYWENLNFPVRDWMADKGESQYRRGLYTWWQRSFLHPSLVAFDAPSREECAADRSRSNIPQQALVLLNDPTYVEAARAFAVRIQESQGTLEQKIAWAMRQTIQRSPTPGEAATLRKLFDQHLSSYRTDLPAAEALLKTGLAPVPEKTDKPELAAWTHVARVLLNLHESITRS